MERARFLKEIPDGRLITVANRRPNIGIYRFVYANDAIDIHLEDTEPQLADLMSSGRATFAIDDVIAFVPPQWQRGVDASHSGLFYRAMTFDCRAEIIEDRDAVASHLREIVHRFQPSGAPLPDDDSAYHSSAARLRLVHLHVTRSRVRFRFGQHMSTEAQHRVIEALSLQGNPSDKRAAGLLARMLRGVRDSLSAAG